VESAEAGIAGAASHPTNKLIRFEKREVTDRRRCPRIARTCRSDVSDLVGLTRQVVDWLMADRPSASRRLTRNKHRRFRVEDVLSLAKGT
jgi:hypothetical protein